MQQYEAQPRSSIADRYRLLEAELARSNLHPDIPLTKSDFFEILDSRIGGKTFDRGIALQLYDRMEKDNSGLASIDEFIKVYIEAQDFLAQNLFQTQQHLHEYETQRQDALEKVEELRHEEILNSYGIMEGSVLTVQILELRDVAKASYKDVFMVVSCGDNTFHTEVYQYANGMEFNDQFNMEIKTGLETIHITLVAYGPNNDQEGLGEVVIPVANLSDQFFRDQMFELQDSRGNLIGGQAHLKLQWVHSRVKYLENVIRKWEENIQVQLEDKEDFEQSLAALQELFPRVPSPYIQENFGGRSSDGGMGPGQYQQGNRGDDEMFQQQYQQRLSSSPQKKQEMSQNKRMTGDTFGNPPAHRVQAAGHYGEEDEPRAPQFQGDMKISGQAPMNRSSQPQDDLTYGQHLEGEAPQRPGMQPADQQIPSTKPVVTDDTVIEWNESTHWGQATFFGTLVLLVLSMFSCFMKASYLEIILCFGLLKEYDLQKRFRGTPETVILLLIILGCATFWDLIWLVIYTGGWGHEVVGWEPSKGAIMFVLIVEYFSLILKFGLVASYFNFLQIVRKKAKKTGLSPYRA